MNYVPTKSEATFIRNEKDLGRCISAAQRRIARRFEAENAPKRYETGIDDHGNRFTIVMHAEKNVVLYVI